MTPDEEAKFFAENAKSFPKGIYLDDSDYDLISLVVVDDVSVEIVNDVLSKNVKDMGGVRAVQLADTHDRLPDWTRIHGPEGDGTEPTVAATWRSPFVGKSLEEIASWIREIPKPPKQINKTYFAVLQKELYEREGQVLICRIRSGKGLKVETIPMDAHSIGGFQWLFRREDWYWCHKEQEL